MIVFFDNNRMDIINYSIISPDAVQDYLTILSYMDITNYQVEAEVGKDEEITDRFTAGLIESVQLKNGIYVIVYDILEWK